jgi:hypothetical protein
VQKGVAGFIEETDREASEGGFEGKVPEREVAVVEG